MDAHHSAHPPLPGNLWPERFELLDACRGIAAVAVVLHHLGLGHSFNLGHNAVLIFFVISGYCIAASADSCMRKGLGFSAYMLRRIRRIYPPYLIALLFFFTTRMVKYWQSGDWQFPVSSAAWIQNFTLTQWLTLLLHPRSWAADNPTLAVAAFWSLNYEEQFYLVVGFLIGPVAALRLPFWVSASFLFATSFAWNVCFPSISYGIFLEYWVLFGAGCLVFVRLCRTHSFRLQWIITLALVILAVLSTYITWFAGLDWSLESRIVYREWAVGFLFAFLLILLRPWSSHLARWRPGRLLLQLGTISYSLYLTHQFNLRFSSTISSHLLWRQSPALCHLLLQVGVLVLLASVFWYFCERPFLNKRLLAKEVVR